MERKAERSANTQDTVVTVGRVSFGRDPFPVVAGPCSVESEEQMRLVAKAVADMGGAMLRGNTVTVDPNPYAFQGLGRDGVRILSEAGAEVGLPTVTQIHDIEDVDLVAEQVDMIEISAWHMQDFELLRVVGQSGKPVLLKRGPSATVDEWLWAAEYILAEGNDQVVMCERGIRTFGENYTLDISAVAMVKERSHLPVIVFPSHAAGERSRVAPLSLASQGVGADGLVIEVHPTPDSARTNPGGQLAPVDAGLLLDRLGINRMRNRIDLIDRDIVKMLARRQRLALEIGKVKAQRNMPVHVPEREDELLAIIREEAAFQGISEVLVDRLFQDVLTESRRAQYQLREAGENEPDGEPQAENGK